MQSLILANEAEKSVQTREIQSEIPRKSHRRDPGCVEKNLSKEKVKNYNTFSIHAPDQEEIRRYSSLTSNSC
jgi:hypothetical protein